MLKLRPYQRAGIDAVYAYWRGGGGNALIELATGTGKSLVAATFCRELIEGWPDMRIGVVTHVKELIGQNAAEMLHLWPQAPIGINSAGLGRRDTRSQILFCGIQSIHKKADILGGFDLLLVDEAHLIPRDGDSMYGRFIADCRAHIADMRIVGLTATPYRLGTGRLDQGEDRVFDEIVYTYGIGEGVRDGYLCPLTSKRAQGQIDVSGVEIRGGEFAAGALENRVMRDAKVAEACRELIEYGRQQKRASWIVFCTGVAHANAVRDELERQGVRAAAVTGDMPASERDRLISAFRFGGLECLTSVGVLTTGFNVPTVDLIALMRPTLSTGLYVQMLGRGTRPVYEDGFNLDSVGGRQAAIAASAKPNCLVLDFAGCGRIHGPVDALTPAAKKKKGDGAAEAKIKPDTERGKHCDQCGNLQPLSASECRDCGHPFPMEAKHEATADAEAAVMKSEEKPEWRKVDEIVCRRHEKAGGLPSFRVDYLCGPRMFSEWLCFEHQGFARDKAHKIWDELCGEMPAPQDVEDAVQRQEEISAPDEILVAKDGSFWRIAARRYKSASAKPLPMEKWAQELDDEIPF